MRRIGPAVLVVALFLLAACGDDGGSRSPLGTPLPDNGVPDPLVTPVTPVPRPEAVPEGASVVTQTTTLGRITRRAGEEPQAVMTRELMSATCADDVIRFETSGEIIYAPHLCQNFWNEEAASLFLDQQVAITLEATDTRFRIFVESLAGAQAEFTVGGVWIEQG